MNILSFIHPVRTFLPCSGAGRFINNTLLELSQREGLDLNLLFSQQWLGEDQKLPLHAPLRNISFNTFPQPENRTERLWKLIQHPKMDAFVPSDTNWIYCPMETLFPILGKTPVAITIYDIQAFEPDLPWSKSKAHRRFAWKWGRWVRKSIETCEIVFTISHFTKSRMVNLLGAPSEKIINVGCGIEPIFFQTAKPTNESAPHVCMVGGLRHKKGGKYYLALAKELQQRKSPILIVIAGPNDKDLEQAAKAYENISLLGMVPDDDLPGLVANSLAMVFLSEYEGFGIPPLEAMASGVPTIVSNRASLPEVVGDAGVVVDPEDTGVIIELLENWLQNPASKEEWILKGRRHAAEFTWSNVAGRVYNALSR